MSYEVKVVDEFQKDLKKLYKKHCSIKKDILLTIYSKTQKESIDVKFLEPILDRLKD